jgi:hypothetical protein
MRRAILENELQRQLQVAHISARTGDSTEIPVAAISGVIRDSCIRVAPVRMVCCIKGFESELKIRILREIEVFKERGIHPKDSRTN